MCWVPGCGKSRARANGATYCCHCRMHRPVGAEGEFTWIDDAGEDTHILVGT